MLKRYISELKAETKRLREVEVKTLHKYPRYTTKPLTDQIEDLMASLPPALRERDWAMADLVGRLQGRYRDRPHPANVGQALRALGWAQQRDWSVSGGGRRVWVPPSLSSRRE